MAAAGTIEFCCDAALFLVSVWTVTSHPGRDVTQLCLKAAKAVHLVQRPSHDVATFILDQSELVLTLPTYVLNRIMTVEIRGRVHLCRYFRLGSMTNCSKKRTIIGSIYDLIDAPIAVV